jgi:hypothetical protein
MPKAITLGPLDSSGHFMPFTAAKEPAALPQINIVTEYDSKSTVATKRQVPGHSNKRPPS